MIVDPDIPQCDFLFGIGDNGPFIFPFLPQLPVMLHVAHAQHLIEQPFREIGGVHHGRMVPAGNDLIGPLDTPHLIRIQQLTLRQTDALGAGRRGEPPVTGRELVAGCGVAAQLVRHFPQGFRVVALQVGPDLAVALDGVGDIVAVLFLELVEPLHIESVAHPASRRHGEFVRHIADGGEIPELIQQEIHPPLQPPAPAIRRLRQKLILLGHNERGNRVKGGFLVRQDHKERLLFAPQIRKGKITGMGNRINGFRGKQPQGGEGGGVKAASGAGRSHIGDGEQRPRRVRWRLLFQILQQGHFVPNGAAHLGNEPIHIRHILKLRPLLVIAHHAEDGGGDDGTLAVGPDFLALRLAHQIVGQIPGQHFRPVCVALVDGVDNRLKQIVTHTLGRVLEVQHQHLISQFF